MEFAVGFVIGIIFNPFIMKCIMMYRSRKMTQIPKRDFGFMFNISSQKNN